jgi:hypothetical protein
MALLIHMASTNSMGTLITKDTIIPNMVIACTIMHSLDADTMELVLLELVIMA